MTRPISLTIHTGALEHNLDRVIECAHGRTVWAVVKANAYGHGIENAVKGFAKADGFALLEIAEARRARAAGWKKRILLIEGFFDADDLGELEALGVETLVHNREQIELLKNTRHTDLKVHLKLNSGMNRLGFAPNEAAAVIDEINAIEGVSVVGIVTHFANSERNAKGEGYVSVAEQLERMKPVLERKDVELCLAKSAATMLQPAVKGVAVRAGIVLYGVSPDKSISEESLGIEPAMTLAARIIAVREVAAGDAVGYGSRWRAEKPTRVAVVTCGYADGYPRSMPDGTPVWVEGKTAPIVGAVSMDMLTIDVTDVPEAHVGSVVELWGRHVSVNDIASRCGTIGYELIVGVARRVPVVAD